MNKKTRIMAMALALLLAGTMIASLILPYMAM